MSQAVDRFVKQHEERFLEELKEFIRIPSISTLPEYDAGKSCPIQDEPGEQGDSNTR